MESGSAHDESSIAGALSVAIIAAGLLLAPAFGATTEELLQDTLKSMVVSCAVLAAAVVFFWQERDRTEAVASHAVVGLPLMLMVYALCSMAWSHTYLAGVEAIRWFVFAVLVWLGMNALTRERLVWLAWGVHLGGAMASAWAVLQFWGQFNLFPQGPPPASTFINRNFFAEFAVCTLPFGAILLARMRSSAGVAMLSFSTGLVVLAIFMTGTRAALVALWLQLLILFPLVVWKFGRALALARWSLPTRLVAVVVLLATVVGLGLIPSGNAVIVQEARGSNALERGFKRTGSISPDDPSLGVRMTMWRATLDMIAVHPIAGVGAGAWENEVPLYQAKGSQLETDYYVHNEYLQLVAEYGVVGWLFLLGLLTFALEAIRRTWVEKHDREEAAWRCVLLCSLAALAVVSSIGFPWRMAVTGALFAVCLAGLGASDMRLGFVTRWSAMRLVWSPLASKIALGFSAAALSLAIYISWQAAVCERDLIRASKLALEISSSTNPRDPLWNDKKRELLELASAGIAINPHYRKITPTIADDMASWGDWRNAVWIWESVLHSRPHVVAIMANVARGYVVMEDYANARVWLDKARRAQPDATAIKSLEVILLARTHDEASALKIVREAIAAKSYDFDLVNTGFTLAGRAGDYELAATAMRLRIARWPASAAQGYMQLGVMYHAAVRDPQQALESFRKAKEAAQPGEWASLSARVPADYREQLGLPPVAVPQVPPAPQMSSSKG
ncbi:O-antigen ligase family protein [Caenimonas koreensis]|uniref:O-antigen ligase-related domain-containing protein n=1 Tax=Caenimonas koreensis DSM 17982 TaxID=1121255 RepID=A0A844AYY2_9BURK|nr:O-antigen ligase family protein [Caenimonas koreensis]MRD49770.1 hypothetical protein [Caenimonas koreensis DSM 17982]